MLQLASQDGFHECAQHHVSTLGIPGNVEGAGFCDSLGGNGGLSARSELAPETESVPAPLESRGIGRVRGLVGPRKDASRRHGNPWALWGTRDSLMKQRLSANTLLGREPENSSLSAHRLRSTHGSVLHALLRQDLPARSRHGIARGLSRSQPLAALFRQAPTRNQRLG
jgi:hypothetical protein